MEEEYAKNKIKVIFYFIAALLLISFTAEGKQKNRRVQAVINTVEKK